MVNLRTPASLRITGAGDFDGSTIGFGSGADGFEASEPAGLGRELILEIDHFSSHGGAEAEAADIANAFKPIVEKRGNLSRAAIREMLRLLAIFDERFSARPNGKPPDFCTAQPVCLQAMAKAERSLEGHITEACSSTKSNPTLFAFRDLVSLQGDLDLIAGNQSFSFPCRDELAGKLTDKVLAAIRAEPLTPFREFELLGGTSGDIDGDGFVSAFEMAHALATEFDFIGPINVPEGGSRDLSQELKDARDLALESVLTDNAARCNGPDRTVAIEDLREGLVYAQLLRFREAEYIEALRGCGVEIVIVPAQIELGTGDTHQFRAILTNPNGDPGDVAWSASGGQVSASGLYTAPSVEGTFTVTLRSTLNPSRSSSATVTVVDDDC